MWANFIWLGMNSCARHTYIHNEEAIFLAFSVPIQPVDRLHVKLERINRNSKRNTDTERVVCMYNSIVVITYFILWRNSVGFSINSRLSFSV